MKKRYDAAVVGEIFADHIFSGFAAWPPAGVEIFTEEYVREVGGGAANTASGLARLGKQTILFGVAGILDRPWLHRRLTDLGVLLDGMKYVEQSTGVTVSISTKEERTFFTYPGSNSQLEEYLQSPDVVASLAEARHVHFAMPLARKIAATLLPELRRAGCTLSMDVGWQLEWLTNIENVGTCVGCDFFLPNEKEARIFTGFDDPSAMLQFCMKSGIPGVVLKLGAMGACMMLDGRELYSERVPVEVIDTTGAGDAFNAGLIDAVLEGLPAEEMLRRACICGALSTQASGALSGLPTRKELEEFYDQAHKS